MPAVIEELLRGLKAADVSAASELLRRLGGLYGAAAAALAEDEPQEEAAAVTKAAGGALGAAIASMGPAAVLQVLPLSLEVLLGPSLEPSRCIHLNYYISCLVHGNVQKRGWVHAADFHPAR